MTDDARLTLDACVADLKLREAEVKLAQATLNAARTRFEQPVHLEAELAEAEAELAAARTQLADLPYQKRTAEARLRFVQFDYDSKSRTVDVVSGRAREQAESELDAARAMVDQLGRLGVGRLLLVDRFGLLAALFLHPLNQSVAGGKVLWKIRAGGHRRARRDVERICQSSVIALSTSRTIVQDLFGIFIASPPHRAAAVTCVPGSQRSSSAGRATAGSAGVAEPKRDRCRRESATTARR